MVAPIESGEVEVEVKKRNNMAGDKVGTYEILSEHVYVIGWKLGVLDNRDQSN